jgi:hypothetical protein
MTPSRPCTPPAYSYSHSQGRSVTGGLILDSPAWVQAFGGPHYLFADYTGSFTPMAAQPSVIPTLPWFGAAVLLAAIALIGAYLGNRTPVRSSPR